MEKFVDGILMSKIRYTIQVANNIWGFEPLREKTRRYNLFTKRMLLRIQSIQNEAMRIQLNEMNQMTPTVELLKRTNKLSIHQMMVQTMIMQMKNLVRTKTPIFLHEKLISRIKRNGQVEYSVKMNKINFNDEAFLHKAAKVWNEVPEDIAKEENPENFKKKIKKWIFENVRIKP